MNFRIDPMVLRPRVIRTIPRFRIGSYSFGWRSRVPNIATLPTCEILSTRDLTMPARDWSTYDLPAKGRYISERTKRGVMNVVQLLPALLRRQA